jgi:hypothetical protein
LEAAGKALAKPVSLAQIKASRSSPIHPWSAKAGSPSSFSTILNISS